MKKRILMIGLITTLMLLTGTVIIDYSYIISRDHNMPVPGEGDEENEKKQKLWFELIHKAAPGVDWRKIEMQNQINNLSIASIRSSDHRSMQESFAAGLLLGDWIERGSENQAGRNIEAEYDAINNDYYVISNNATLFKKNLASGDWVQLNRLKLGRHILKVVKKPDGSNRLFVSWNSRLVLSDNNGANFGNIPGFTANPLSIISLNDAFQTIYCLAADGIYISTNLGGSFTKIFTVFPGDGTKVSLNKTHNSDEVYFLDTRFTGGINLYTIVNNTVTLTSTGTGTEVNVNCILRSVNIAGSTTWYVLLNGNKVYRSTNAGINWILRNTVAGSYTFEISMNDPEKLFIGGLEAWRSFNGGLNWTLVNGWGEYYTNVVGKLHADIMRISAYRKMDGTTFLLINNDGGTAISSDDLVTTTNISLNTLHNSEYYDVITDSENPANIFAGSQDQGLQRNLNSIVQQGPLNFDQIISGDYTQMAISGDATRHLWVQYPGARITYYHNSTGSPTSSWTMPGSALPNYGWTMPISNIFNRKADQVLIGGGDLSGGGGSYIMKLTPTGGPPQIIMPTQYNYNFRAASNNGTAGVTAIEAVRNDSNRIYVATEDGTFFFTNNAGQNWTKASFSGPTPGFLYGTSIYSSRLTSNLLWYAGTGYSNPPVFKSSDGGLTFTAVNNGLPPTVIYDLVANPWETMLFAATDAGPWVYVVANNQWYSMIGADNPVHTYTSVHFVEDLNIVRFGTYSRGIWDFKINNAPPPKPRITFQGTGSACDNDSILLTSSAASGNQWFRDGAVITGATNNTYKAFQSGVYTTLTTVNNLTSLPSEPVTIIIKPRPPKPTITNIGGDLTSSAINGNQWFRNAILIAGANQQVYRPSSSGLYSVQVTENGCQSIMSDILDFTITGINDPNALENKISAFPNPMINELVIKNNKPYPVTIQLFNMGGQNVFEANKIMGNYIINVKKLSMGAYTLIISDEKTKKKMRKMFMKK